MSKNLGGDIDILHYFCLEILAGKAARELCSSYNIPELSCEPGLDEIYSGGKQKGKRGRGAFNKPLLFGILKRDGKVYAKVVPGVKAKP